MALTYSYTKYDGVFPSNVQLNSYLPGDARFPVVLGLSGSPYYYALAYETGTASGDGTAGSIYVDFFSNFTTVGATYHTPYPSGSTQTIAYPPTLTQLSNGNVLLAWYEYRSPTDYGTRGRLLTPAGAAIGDELQLNTSGFGDPKVAALVDGGFVVSTTYGGSDISQSRYNASGALLSSSQVNTVANAGTQGDSHVAALADGGYVVTYTDSSGSNPKIRAAIFHADGSTRKADFVLDASSGSQSQTAVATLPNGNFAVVYQTTGIAAESGSKSIVLAIFKGDGTPVIGSIPVNATTTGSNESDPDLAVLDGGRIAVTWTYPVSSTNHDIYGRIYDQNGSLITFQDGGSQFGFAINSSDSVMSTVSSLRGKGNYFIGAWQDSATDSSGGSIHGSVGYFQLDVTGANSNDVLVSTSLAERFNGSGGDDRFIFKPGGGVDTLIDFGSGYALFDKVVLAAFSDIHSLSDVMSHIRYQINTYYIDLGKDGIYLPQNLKPSDLTADDFILEYFGQPKIGLSGALNPSNGWISQDSFPRQLADVNGDGSADIIGFGNGGVYVALATGGGNFATPVVKLNAFNPGNGWTSQDQFPRLFADVNKDSKADIVAFGNGGVYVATANTNGDGGFATPEVKLNAFNPANGWTSQDQFPRLLGDVDGDGRADIVAFGNGGVYVSLATTTGGFAAPVITVPGAFNPANGWTSQDQFPRLLGDVNGDGKADIVAFGNAGVYVALATTNGSFTSPVVTLNAFNPGNGWTSQNQFLRQLADVDGDGMADIVGFGNGGVYVATASGAGRFFDLIVDIPAFNPANGWTNDTQFHRAVADVNGDGSGDIVGFGNPGVLVSLGLVNEYHVI